MRILITGGAGFVGSHLSLSFKREKPDSTVIAFDNLKHRGSELALQRLASVVSTSVMAMSATERILRTQGVSICLLNVPLKHQPRQAYTGENATS
jgi:nucleoside-diphosphate-sugar epimerase